MTKSSCLDEETLTSYLEGLLDAPVRAATESHLVDCDMCRSQLVYYMRILDEDVREEEDSVIHAAIAAVRHHDGPGLNPRKSRVVKVRWGWVAAAAVLAAIGAGVVVDSMRGPSAAEIVHLLFSNERPFQARLSVQPYFEYSRVRSADAPSGGARLDLDLETEDASLLGAYYLYLGRFDEAIRLLERAVAENPVASVHNDLGVAYLEKPDSSADERAVNQRRARDQFNRALDLDPEYLASVYNLAVLFSREDLPGEVRQQLDRYTALEPDSEWVDELKKLVPGEF